MTRSGIVTLSAIAVAMVGGAAWLVLRPAAEPVSSAPEATVAISKSEPKVEPPPETVQPRSGDHSPDRNDSRLNQLQTQMEALQQQLEAQRRELADFLRSAKASNRPVARGEQAGAGSESYSVSEQEQELADQKREEARLFQLQTQFASQGKDSGWSRTAETQIAATVKQVAEASGAGGPELRDADCRSALCRFTVSHKDAASAQGFLGEFPNRLGWRKAHGRVQYVNHPDGSVETVVYLSREARPLYETGN